MKGRPKDSWTVSWRCSVTPEVRSVTFTRRSIVRWTVKPCETRVGRLVEDQGGQGGSRGSVVASGGPADALALDWRGIVWDLLPVGYLNSVGDTYKWSETGFNTHTGGRGRAYSAPIYSSRIKKNVEWYPSMTNFNLTWPVTSSYAIQILKLDYGTKLEIILFVLTNETQWCQMRCLSTRTLGSEVIEKQHKVWKIVLDALNFDLECLSGWPEVKPEEY